MGSPYHVHSHITVSTVRSIRGFNRVVDLVRNTMGVPEGVQLTSLVGSPEYRVLTELHQTLFDCLRERSRKVVFLEARYYWTGWEKFQRAIIVDFSHDVRPDEGVTLGRYQQAWFEGEQARDPSEGEFVLGFVPW